MSVAERLGAKPALRTTRSLTPGREIHHGPKDPAYSLEETYERWQEVFPSGPVVLDPKSLLPTPFHEHQTEERKTDPPTGLISLLHFAGYNDLRELTLNFRKGTSEHGPLGREPLYKFSFSWERGRSEPITFNRFNISLREHVWRNGRAIWVGDGPIHSFSVVDEKHPNLPHLPTENVTGNLLASFERFIGRGASLDLRSMVAAELISVVHPQGFRPNHYPFER